MTIASGRLTADFNVQATDTYGSGTPQFSLGERPEATFSNGTGANQANELYSYSNAALTSGQVITLDLDAGTLLNAFGDTITFARIKGLLIHNTGTTNLTVSGTNGAAKAGVILPGGFLLVVASDATAYPVAAASTDTIIVTNAAATGGGVKIQVLGVV